MSVITLTTDFGTGDSYAAQMKGVMLAINPRVQIVDVTHEIPPQNVARAAAVLDEIAGVFPPGTIHMAIVDPGVGGDRACLAAEAFAQRFLAPDNGLLSSLFRRREPVRVHRLEDDRFWRTPVSATFHGRDIFAPVAAHWSRGADIADFGPAVDPSRLVELPCDRPRQSGQGVVGRIESVDGFGNLITNLGQADLPERQRDTLSIALGGRQILGIDRCYADRPVGSLMALFGSSGRLEIAVNQGSAAKTLNLGIGAEVRID